MIAQVSYGELTVHRHRTWTRREKFALCSLSVRIQIVT